MSTLSMSTLSENRRKQSKKDEAIRRKIESELSRKRVISTSQGTGVGGRSKRANKAVAPRGTVAALRPGPALTVPESITVSEASQLCAAKRTDCVLVVDADDALCGIFTAKDLAYRVTAEGLDPHVTPVSHIMTRSPMVTRDTTSATDALQLMVQRHFRHLPVCNEEGNVVGLLDITKVFHEALNKVERGSSASEKLYDALAGVQSELGLGMASNPQTAAMLAYVDALREKTALPDLNTVIDPHVQPATVTPKSTVRDVARLMRERRTTAVCVVEHQGAGTDTKVVGIFTSKDVVLRVIAAGLDAAICSVIRVMTPHPDVAQPTMTIRDALKKMHEGHYLNLPVVDSSSRLIAIVDVLKLTYATLEQMNAMTADAMEGAGENDGGPMWGRFFESLGANDDNESILSGSHIPEDAPSVARNSHLQLYPFSEVHPSDSASVIGELTPELDNVTRRRKEIDTLSNAPNVSADDGTYTFKLRMPSGRTHRFQARYDSLEILKEIVTGKMALDNFFTEYAGPVGMRPDPNDYQLSYTDADSDVVSITGDVDIVDAVRIARSSGSDRVVLLARGGKSWLDAGWKDGHSPENVQVQLPSKEMGVNSGEPPIPSQVYLEQPLVLGIPKDLLLPASIGALAVAVLVVFAFSRTSR